MAQLNAARRRALPDSVFALSGKRFPIPDKTHARLAKSGASRALRVGNITPAQKKTIDAKANRKLGR